MKSIETKERRILNKPSLFQSHLYKFYPNQQNWSKLYNILIFILKVVLPAFLILRYRLLRAVYFLSCISPVFPKYFRKSVKELIKTLIHFFNRSTVE